MKAILFISLSLILVFSCADLRTDVVKKEMNEDKARELISAMEKAHRIDQLDSIQTYSIFFQDHFYGRIGKVANPFPEEITKMRLDYLPGDFNGRITFQEGEWKGKQWGFFSNHSYENINHSDTLQYSKEKDIRFWVTSYQYFLEFPARIAAATAIGYVGEKQIGQFACEGIMASWGTLEPQRKIDQYVIWVDTETHRIVKINYSIREVNTMVKGGVYFKGYESFNDLLLPTRMPVESNMVRDGMLHEMRIDSVHINEITKASLEPEPSLIKIN